MRRRISLYSTKSSTYIFNNFQKQFRKALESHNIGQFLTWKHALHVLSFMGFVDEEPTEQDEELAKTLTKMLSNKNCNYQARKNNLFTFLCVLCGISRAESHDSYWADDGEAEGLALDCQPALEPLIIIQIGKFDINGRWTCTDKEAEQIQKIFHSMCCKRISRNEVESRKKQPKAARQSETFQPKICPKSAQLAQKKYKKLTLDIKNSQIKPEMLASTPLARVENRLLMSRNSFNSKIKEQLNRSIEKELEECTFKPQTNSRSCGKENASIRSNSLGHLKNLLDKGSMYKERKQRLHEIKIKLDQSAEVEKCTFKPQTTKHCQSAAKWVYVRNRDKEIQRLREGRKQREFINQVKERGYPTNVNWSQFLSRKSRVTCHEQSSVMKSPILCIDLKIMNEQFNINVYEGEQIRKIAERIGQEHHINQKMWWKVEELIKKAIDQCEDVRITNNRIFADEEFK